MDEYDLVKKTNLKFKGEKKPKKSKKRKHETQEAEDTSDKLEQRELQEDAAEHGDWWKATRFDHVRGDVAIEFLPGCYAKSLSNGRIILGQPHPPNEGPDEEEIFTVVGGRLNHISFKTGFDRYWGIDNKKRLMGLSEAIGQMESFEPVFEGGKTALSAQNDCFLSVDEESNIQQIVSKSTKAGPNELLTIRVPNNPRSI